MDLKLARYSLPDIQAGNALIDEAMIALKADPTSALANSELEAALALAAEAGEAAVFVCVCCERRPNDENECGCDRGYCRNCWQCNVCGSPDHVDGDCAIDAPLADDDVALDPCTQGHEAGYCCQQRHEAGCIER